MSQTRRYLDPSAALLECCAERSPSIVSPTALHIACERPTAWERRTATRWQSNGEDRLPAQRNSKPPRVPLHPDNAMALMSRLQTRLKLLLSQHKSPSLSLSQPPSLALSDRDPPATVILNPVGGPHFGPRFEGLRNTLTHFEPLCAVVSPLQISSGGRRRSFVSGRGTFCGKYCRSRRRLFIYSPFCLLFSAMYSWWRWRSQSQRPGGASERRERRVNRRWERGTPIDTLGAAARRDAPPSSLPPSLPPHSVVAGPPAVLRSTQSSEEEGEARRQARARALIPPPPPSRLLAQSVRSWSSSAGRTARAGRKPVHEGIFRGRARHRLCQSDSVPREIMDVCSRFLS